MPNKGLVERAFIRCDDTMTTYTPLCRQGDLGVTPSQIIANSIDEYEWQYQWRNFRDYRKVWDESAYANAVAGYIVDQRRFLSQWAFDWSPGEISTLLYRVGVTPPTAQGAVSSADYYGQLTYKFLVEMSKANQMVAAFSEALIQETAGQRPVRHGIRQVLRRRDPAGHHPRQVLRDAELRRPLDQQQLRPEPGRRVHLDVGQLRRLRPPFQSIAETSIASMIGSQYAVYPYFIPTAVSLFAQDTHNPAFLGGGGRVEAKDWIGGITFGGDGLDPTPQLIAYFQDIAIANSQFGFVSVPDPGDSGSLIKIPCVSQGNCSYNVTDPTQVFHDPTLGAFIGPDGLNYVYMTIPSRNQMVLAREDRNIVTWKLVEQYNGDVIGTHDDGSQGTYGYEYQIKYTIDAYQTFENGDPIPTAPASSM